MQLYCSLGVSAAGLGEAVSAHEGASKGVREKHIDGEREKRRPLLDKFRNYEYIFLQKQSSGRRKTWPGEWRAVSSSRAPCLEKSGSRTTSDAS
jgi:hypothetical protein